MGVLDKRKRATLIGLLALVMWSMMFGFVRRTSSAFGEYLGPALIYTLAATLVYPVFRPSPVAKLPRTYVLLGGGLFIAYETVTALAIGLAATNQQTLEVSLVNYLWPSLLVLVSAFADKFHWLDEAKGLLAGEGEPENAGGGDADARGCDVAPALRPKRGVIRKVIPGVAVATFGVLIAVGGNNGLDAASMLTDISANPAPFALCLSGALIWAFYSAFVGFWAKGADATAYFLGGVAVVMWAIFLTKGAPIPSEPVSLEGWLSLAGAAGSIGAGYAFWGYGMNHGDLALIGIGSYAAPLLSVIASVVILGVNLTPIFWAGTVCVVAGSLINWRMRR
jgi:drug/metabolite transporter (DMT)-like permease